MRNRNKFEDCSFPLFLNNFERGRDVEDGWPASLDVTVSSSS